MQSLYKYLEGIYNENLYSFKINYNLSKADKFDDLIGDDKKCVRLIDVLANIKDGDNIRSIDNVANLNRASHIVVTWLLGIGLAQAFRFGEFVKGFGNLYFEQLWLQSAMLHDYGYFRDEIKEATQISELTKEYNLLTDFYVDSDLNCLNGMTVKLEFEHFFSYTYSEIKNYYRYRQDYYRSISPHGDEVSDHGIVGGCIAFKNYCKKLKRDKARGLAPSSVISSIQKISCIISASHNIHKSSLKTDKIYVRYGLEKLTSDSSVRVTRKNPLLLLLSLVDTIECTKRFSKKENAKEYLIQSTTLKYVDIDASDRAAIIDFTRLESYLANVRKSLDMREKLISHINAIKSIDDWTDFTVFKIDGDELKLHIELKDALVDM